MRCFLAIELPDAIRRELGKLQECLRSVDKAVRWVRPEQIHITLKFLGEVPDAKLPAVCDVPVRAAERFGPFDLEVRGTGCFPPSGSPRVLWAALADIPEALARCQHQCEQAYAELGYTPENRAFKPHLTLGRVREGSSSRGVREAVKEQEGFFGGRFTARELILFQSVLGPGGAKYVPIVRAALAG